MVILMRSRLEIYCALTLIYALLPDIFQPTLLISDAPV